MKKESVTQERADNGDDTTKLGGKKKKEKASRMSSKEKKEKNNEELRPIVVQLVNEIHDFGAGFHKPTWRDLLGLDIIECKFFSFLFKLFSDISCIIFSCEDDEMAI
jgi:hypothetical protein